MARRYTAAQKAVYYAKKAGLVIAGRRSYGASRMGAFNNRSAYRKNVGRTFRSGRRRPLYRRY